jgi:hypothetical protein|uniref:DUF5067 domain-containing protein n=1 Tax=Agathobacter sp. TaxID=2021311 RepID=UPI0040260C03
MKKRMQFLAILLASTVVLGGCGTSLYELTDDEEDLIVSAAAQAVAKHNVFQMDGITDVETETQMQENTTEQDTQQVQEETNTNTNTGGTKTDTQTKEIALSDLLGKNLKVSYKGYSTASSYQEGDYFSVNAASGKTLIIMNINVKNTGKKNTKIDMLSKDVTFYGCFNGTDRMVEKKILSKKNLSTYQGKIKPGKSIKTVLVFEVSKKQADEISTQDLQVEMDGQMYQVTM